MKLSHRFNESVELPIELTRKRTVKSKAPNPPHVLLRGVPHGVPHESLAADERLDLARSPRIKPTTVEIRTSTARGILDAAHFAMMIGLPFNRFVTIHWDAANVANDQSATARFLKLASDWSRVHGGTLSFAWVRENGDSKGRHVHILMHLPPDLVTGFNRRQRGWLTACGAKWRRGVILSRPIGRSLQQAMSGGSDYQHNLSTVLDYVLKGADNTARSALGIVRQEDAGSVIGKRCGCSQNIGPQARRRRRADLAN